jgi:hypothetical protein
VNFQMSRLRLASVGPDPARYDPLEFDLRKPDQTGPADSVLFLPNTGGKTVLMRLLFSVLHPPIVERIGTEETAQRQKNLLGYVLERDTAHVVIEWRRVEAGRFVDDEALVTGLVAEWRGGKPTGKPEDLNKLWYSIRGPVHLVGVDRLAFEIDVVSDTGSVRRRLPLRRFREQLEELRKMDTRTKLELSTTEVQRDWIDHLDKLGLDRALFRYQGEISHNEAGASAIAGGQEQNRTYDRSAKREPVPERSIAEHSIIGRERQRDHRPIETGVPRKTSKISEYLISGFWLLHSSR